MSTIMEDAQRRATEILDRAAERASVVLMNAAHQEARAVRESQRVRRPDGGVLHYQPSIDKRYRDRLAAAQGCWEILANAEPFEFIANYGASPKRSESRHSSELLARMVEAVIANPHYSGEELGRPFGHGATWFNTVLRKGLIAAGVT